MTPKGSLHFRFTVLTILVFANIALFAQQGRNISFLRVVPQSGYINPAVVPPYNFYIGFPLISSLKLEAENTPFHYKDIIKTRWNDSLYIDTEAMLNSLNNKNYFVAEFADELISFGFRVNKAFVTFNVSEKFNCDIMYPKEFMSLVIGGNEQYQGTTVNAGGIDLNATHYQEIAAGLSLMLSNKVTAGFRVKYLAGIFNVDTRSTDINLYSPDEFSLVVNSDVEVNTSIPGTMQGKGDSLGFYIDTQDYIEGFTSFDNNGFAFDLGAQYMPNEKLTLGLSITDLGYINWKSGVKNLVTSRSNSTFTYSGIDFGSMFNDSTKFEDQLSEVIDSLKKSLGMKVTYQEYTSYTIPKIYLSGTFSLTPKDHFGGLVRLDIFKGNVLPSLTLNYTREFGKAFSLMGGYTVKTGSYDNIAFGFAINAGPIQLYALTDNILGIVMLTSTRYTNTHFGINFVFGRERWYNKPEKSAPQFKPYGT